MYAYARTPLMLQRWPNKKIYFYKKSRFFVLVLIFFIYLTHQTKFN